MLIVPVVSVELSTDIDDVDAPRGFEIVMSVASTVEAMDSITYSGEISDRASVRPDDREVVLDFIYGYAETKRQLLKKVRPNNT